MMVGFLVTHSLGPVVEVHSPLLVGLVALLLLVDLGALHLLLGFLLPLKVLWVPPHEFEWVWL